MVRIAGLEPALSHLAQRGLEPLALRIVASTLPFSHIRIFLRLGGATPPAHISLFTQESRDRFYRQPIRESFTLPTPFHAGYLLTSNAVPHERFTHLPISSRVLHHFSFTSILYHILIYLSSVF